MGAGHVHAARGGHELRPQHDPCGDPEGTDKSGYIGAAACLSAKTGCPLKVSNPEKRSLRGRGELAERTSPANQLYFKSVCGTAWWTITYNVEMTICVNTFSRDGNSRNRGVICTNLVHL